MIPVCVFAKKKIVENNAKATKNKPPPLNARSLNTSAEV
jgi:hypothetical protein